ncbi:MAG TPA: sodium:proline symporter [Rariglobus sp.]
MRLPDWILFLLPLVIVIMIGAYARRYMKSVAHFMSGGRLAQRYLLAVATGEMQAGAVVFVASFERIAQSGFTITWWQWLPVPFMLVLGIFGFVGYRFRETRSLTLAQFFEVRYSKKFRIFNGGLCFLAGLANFGIIPAVGARCFVYFLGLPESIDVLGHVLPTYIPLMAVFLSVTVAITLAGGFVTVMVTDCIEGIISQIFYLFIVGALLWMFPWGDISETLSHRPPGQSMLNPFDSQGLKDFNLWYVLMGMISSIYGYGAWRNSSSYGASALTPHEGRMGGILGGYRELGKLSVVTLLAVCAITFLQHPDFAARSAEAHQMIDGISNPQIRQQMTVPVALSHLLPIGIKGMLCAILLMGVFGGDSTHLHSWSSIFVQDVLLARRKKPFEPRQHIRILRLSVCGVALSVFIFGCLFRQTEYIFMWWAVTTAIYVGGTGACILGGLYWKKGTTAGAWSAMITGSTLSVSGIIARIATDGAFPLNGVQISFCSMLIAVTVYVVVSLLTCRQDFNLDRMLHRGPYAVIANQLETKVAAPAVSGLKTKWGRYIGFDENFTKGDKWIAGGMLVWSLTWFGVMVVGSIWNLISPWPLVWWSRFWHVVGIGIPVVITVVVGVWFTWGGVRDIRALFRRLATTEVNDNDSGFVVGHHNLEEETVPKPKPPTPVA